MSIASRSATPWVASFLLLIAAVGAVVLARRRRGIEDDTRDDLSPLHLLRPPPGTGTMAEAVGVPRFAPARAATLPAWA